MNVRMVEFESYRNGQIPSILLQLLKDVGEGGSEAFKQAVQMESSRSFILQCSWREVGGSDNDCMMLLYSMTHINELHTDCVGKLI